MEPMGHEIVYGIRRQRAEYVVKHLYGGRYCGFVMDDITGAD